MKQIIKSLAYRESSTFSKLTKGCSKLIHYRCCRAIFAIVFALTVVWGPMNSYVLAADSDTTADTTTVQVDTSNLDGSTTDDTSIDYGTLFNQIMETVKQDYLNTDDISEKELFEAAMKGMFDKLDQYSLFMTPKENQSFTNAISPSIVGIGVGLKRIGDETIITNVFEGSPAYNAGVKKGDYFKAVDGQDVTDMAVDDLLNLVLGEEGSNVIITFGRGNSDYTVTIKRAVVKVPSVEAKDISELDKDVDKSIASQIGYINISSFSGTADKEFDIALQKVEESGAEYLILDMRNNGGGYVSTAVNIAKKLVPEGEIVSFVDNSGNEVVYSSDLQDPPYQIVALVNGNSASATEFVTGALQDSKVATIVGETTYGKGVAQYLLPIPEDYTIKLTVEEFFTRDHHKINGLGVTPDVVANIPNYIAGDVKYYINDKADEITNIENILTLLGYDVGTPDNNYDQKTFDAIKKFQIDQGLYGYGACDFTTEKYLNTALQKSVLEHDPQLEAAVQVIMNKMNKK